MQVEIETVRAVHRDAGVLMAGFGEVDTPEEIGRLSPAAAGRKAALASESLAEGDRWRECIGCFPKRELVVPDENRNGEKSADQAAVINSTRTQEIEREDLNVFLDEVHKDLRPEQSADQRPEPEVIDPFARKPVTCREP